MIVALAVTVGGIVLGLTGAAGLAVVEWTAWMLVLPSRKPGSVADHVTFATDPDCPERRLGEPIEAVAPDGVWLTGLWHPAIRSSPRDRAVLLIHGFAEDPAALGSRMETLNRRGWGVAALDVRAHGRSGGDRGSFGGREAADVSAWIEALAASGKLGRGPVAVWGRSMGAAIAVLAAAANPRVTALVLESPYLDLEATLGGVLKRKRVPLPRVTARLILWRAARLAGVPLASPRPVDVASRVVAPTLVMHGADDALIPAADARRLALTFPRSAEYVEIPGAAHNTVVDVGGPDLLDRIATFLDRAVVMADDR